MTTQTDNARRQAKAQFESVAEMVAALNVDYDRLEELRDHARENAWTAGWNMAGYMPDGEPGTYEDEDDARTAVVDELRERADDELETADALEGKEKEDAENRAGRYREAADHVGDSKNASVVVNGWHFWVTESHQGGLDDDDYQELRELEAAAGECEDREDAEQRIHEDALSVEVRGDWYVPAGDGDTGEPCEYKIVLCTGGPHVEIRGDLDSGTPTSARLYCQDWFTLLEDVPGDEDTLLEYATQFFFGE